jgi:hypothetical protein
VTPSAQIGTSCGRGEPTACTGSPMRSTPIGIPDLAANFNTITLRPGIAFCFRKFHPLISDLVRTADLNEFLFGSERAAWPSYARSCSISSGAGAFTVTLRLHQRDCR